MGNATERAFDRIIARRLSLDRYSALLQRELRQEVSPQMRKALIITLASLLSKPKITRLDMNQAIQSFQEALRPLTRTIRQRLLTALQGIIEAEIQFGQRVIQESTGGAEPPVPIPDDLVEELLDEERIEENIRNVSLGVGLAFATLLRRLRAQALHVSMNKSIQEVLTGGLSQELHAEISRALTRPERTDLGKVLDQADQALTRMVHTETFDRANAALSATYAAHDRIIRGEYLSAILDRRTCQQCAALDGMIFWYAPPPQGYDERNRPISEQPRLPLHPNCRCVYVPVLDEARRPYRESYAEWFARQPEEVQRDILGPGKYTLYKQGRINIYDLGSYEGIVTLKELRGD
ncbi:MAG: phage minor head protein [Candidatus Caldarchaeum sp.]